MRQCVRIVAHWIVIYVCKWDKIANRLAHKCGCISQLTAVIVLEGQSLHHIWIMSELEAHRIVLMQLVILIRKDLWLNRHEGGVNTGILERESESR